MTTCNLDSPGGAGHSSGYRPEIDGLRALAVIAVVMFHAGFSFPGGYVGVDVFFVISGYLITSLILKDLNRGAFSLLDFWERRIRRIFPALFVVICVSLVAGLGIMPHDFRTLGTTALLQPLTLVNIYFWQTTGYFSSAQETKPLLHTWSLAVEEQFYIILPFFLMLLYRSVWMRRRGALFAILVLVSAGSLMLAVHLIPTQASAAFFLLPSRIWELMAGSLVALAGPVAGSIPRWCRELISWLGLGGIIWAIVSYGQGTPFPGLAAAPPVLGTALFILCNARMPGPDTPPTFAGRLLAIRPLVFIGLISYSLYLWHWPLLAFGGYWFAGHRYVPGGVTAALVATSFLCAILSWSFIETPFRRKKVAGSRHGIFTFAASGSVILMITGAAILTAKGFPNRFSPTIRANSSVAEDWPAIHPGQSIGDLTRKDEPPILLWGDSHSRCLAGALDIICKEDGHRAVYLDSNATAPAELLETIRTSGTRHLIIAQYWVIKNLVENDPLHRSLVDLCTAADGMGCKVWFLLDVPDTDAEVPRALVREELYGWPSAPWRRSVADHRARNAVPYLLAASGLPATFIDLAPPFLDASGTMYRADEDGISLYCDDDHISNAAAIRCLLPLLRSEMSGKLGAGASGH